MTGSIWVRHRQAILWGFTTLVLMALGSTLRVGLGLRLHLGALSLILALTGALRLRIWWHRVLMALAVALVTGALQVAGQAIQYGDAALFGASGAVLAIFLAPTAVAGALLVGITHPTRARLALRATPALLLGLGLLIWLWSSPSLPRNSGGAAPAASPAAGSGQLLAGAAWREISPGSERIYLGGYGGRPGPATGVSEPLTVRAFILQRGTVQVAFLTLDAVGVGNRLSRQLQALAGGANGFVSATHTHAGPDLQGIWGGVDPAYEQRILRAAREALTEARQGLRPATLTAAAGRASGLQRNRRGWPQTPERLSVLRAVGPDGITIATLTNYGAHPTVLPRENLRAGPDFIGPLNRAIEQRFGGVSLFINGALGDVVPASPQARPADPFAAAEAYGIALAARATDLISGPERLQLPAEAALSVRHAEYAVPLSNWGFQALFSLGWLRYDPQFSGLAPVVRTRASLVRLGDSVAMVTAPGEVATRLAAEAEGLNRAPVPFFLGLTHDSLGYIISRDEWMTGRNKNYEESVSVGPQAGPAYLKAVQSLLK